jgi:hypothetical protein
VRSSLPALVAAVLCAVAGCTQQDTRLPATASPPPAHAEPAAPAPDTPVTIADDDRTCERDADCTAILTQCSMCEGACTGVRIDRAARYEGRLDCTGYRGGLCNYDCRPEFKIEAPRCRDHKCESVRLQ